MNLKYLLHSGIDELKIQARGNEKDFLIMSPGFSNVDVLKKKNMEGP